MAKTKEKKAEEVKKIVDNFADAKSVVFTSYNGLTVADSQELRNDLRKEDVTYLVSKKTLLRRALETSSVKDVDIDSFDGSMGLAFAKSDEVAPAKILAKFAKGHDNLKIHGGILEGSFIGSSKVMELAMLPSRDEMIAKTVATIAAPISSFVNVLAGNIKNVINVLNSIKEKKV